MAIFKDLVDFREDIPEVNQNYEWIVLSKRIKKITRLAIIPLIGDELYADLEGKYLGSINGGTSEKETVFIEEFLQPAIAGYTYISLLSTNRVSLGQMGVQENRSADSTSNPASFHAIADVKEEHAWMAYQIMDDGLKYLDKNNADFPKWKSGAGESRREQLVYNAEILNAAVPIGGSLQTFLLLKGAIAKAQTQIAQNFAKTYWDNLIVKNKEGEFLDHQAAILPYIKEYIATTAIIQTIPFVRVLIKPEGLLIRGQLNGPERKTPAQDNEVREITAYLMDQKNSAYASIFRILESEPTLYEHNVSSHVGDDGQYSYHPDNRNKRSYRV